MTNAADPQSLRTAYDQLCVTYRAIDDFRAKLLGFLPVVTGGGLLVLTGKGDALAQDLFLPAGIFGIAVTLGLFVYEIYGTKRCHALIKAGIALESSLGLKSSRESRCTGSVAYPGQFQDRPREVLGHLNEPFAAAIIYPAVMAAWSYLAVYQITRTAGALVAAAVFVAGFSVTFAYNSQLRKDASQSASDPTRPPRVVPN
jgi:hypothetical protein